MEVLKETGKLLDWISIHGYWSRPSDLGEFERDYRAIVARAFEPEKRIEKTKHILGALGFLGKVRISFYEWNLRNWCHPGFFNYDQVDHRLMDKNDLNSNYTMADAIFTACFLNTCLRHCDTVGMANFFPVVNTVGAIYTHSEGTVLRPSYHVFDLFNNHTFEEIVHSVLASPTFEVDSSGEEGKTGRYLDTIVTRDPTTNQLGVVLINLHEEDTINCRIRGLERHKSDQIQVHTLAGDSVSTFNDIDHPHAVSIEERSLPNVDWNHFEFPCPAHSVSVLNTKLSTP